LHLTGAKYAADSDYACIIYKANVKGVADFNRDTQSIKRLVNEKLRATLEDPNPKLPCDIQDVIKDLIPAVDSGLHYNQTILQQIINNLAGNFTTMKQTQIFRQLKNVARVNIKELFEITDESSSDNILLNASSSSMLRILLGKPGRLHDDYTNVIDDEANDQDDGFSKHL